MISLTTLLENRFPAVLTSRSSMVCRVLGPNSGAMYAKLPSIPRSSGGGSDSALQNAAAADSEKIESSQLLPRVRFNTGQAWRRDGLAGVCSSFMTTPAFTTATLRARSGGLMNDYESTLLVSSTAASSTNLASCSLA